MKSNQSLIYKVSIVLLTLVTLVFIAIPADSNFKSFSDSVGKTLGRDVSMVSSVQFVANEGSSIFLPEKIDRFLAFRVPQAMSSFIFPRDSMFTYKDGFLVVSDRLSNELTRLPLGEEVKLSFERTDLNIGSAFKIPKLEKDYFIVALNGSTIRNFFTVGNSSRIDNGEYSSLSPVALVGDLALVGDMIASDSYRSAGDVLNEVFAFLYSGDINAGPRKGELLKKIDKATAETTLDSKIEDKIKNDILAVYAETAGLVEKGANVDDDRYSNILSGIQVELSNRILRSNKTLTARSQASSEDVTVLNESMSNSGNVLSGTSSQRRALVQAATTTNAKAVSAKTIDPRSLVGIPRLPMPAKAKVGTTSILTPCELTNGYLIHYLQDRECTGANIISIPLGIFNLIYNSSKPDDSFYGIQRAKTNYDEYITSDLRFYINSLDQKIPLVKSGASLTPSFVWGVSPFKASGGRYVREERKSGFKYIYAKASASDTKFRLVEVQLLDNSKVIGLQFKSVSPFDLTSIEYRAKKEDKVLRKATLSTSEEINYGTVGIIVSIKYPNTEDVFKNVSITSYNGALFGVSIGDKEYYQFNSQGKLGEIFPIAMRNYWVLANGQVESAPDRFFGYDKDGTKVFSQTNSSNQTGTTFVRSVDYTYPKLADSHNVNYKDNFNKSGSTQYRNFGWNVLKVATSTPFGNDLFQYKTPLYSLYRHYSARDKKWATEVLKFEDGATEVRFNKQIVSVKEVNGATTTIFKDLNNKEILKSVYLDKGNGQFSSTLDTGVIRKIESKTNVVGSVNSYRETTATEVAGKKASDVNTLVTDTSVQLNDVLKGSSYKEIKVGDKVTQTYTEPNRPVYTKEITSSTSNKIDTTQTIEKVGTEIVSKSVTKAVDEPAGTSWVVDQYVPVEGSTKWRQNSSGYDATRKESLSKESISPVGGR